MTDNVQNTGEKKPSLLSTALKIVAIPIAAFTGWWVTAISIRNSVYDRLKAHGAFASLKPNDKEYQVPPHAHIHESQEKSSTRIATAVIENGAGEGFVDQINRWDKQTEKSIGEQLAKYDGLNKFTKQWKFSHLTHKQRALLEGFTAAGIAIGAIYAIANSKTISTAFAARDKEQQQDQPPSL